MTTYKLTEGLEDADRGLVCRLGVGLVVVVHAGLRVALAPFLVAGLAAVAAAAMEALGYVHADVHGVVACGDAQTQHKATPINLRNRRGVPFGWWCSLKSACVINRFLYASTYMDNFNKNTHKLHLKGFETKNVLGGYTRCN